MELSREQRKKALKACVIDHNCNECPYQRMATLRNCVEFNMVNAFSVIEELTAENERLRREEKQSQILIKTLHDKLDEGYAKFVDEERADTVRKMREWLQERVKGIYLDEGDLFEILNEYEKQISEDS